MFISKGSYGYGETRNVFLWMVQNPLLPVRAVKLLRLKGVGTGPRTETSLNCGGPIAMVPCLHQGNIYIKRKLRVWRDQKCIPLVGTKISLTSAGREITPSQGSQNRPDNGNLHNLGWTCCHGTPFAPRQYLYQKEATGMESPEMYSLTRCRNPSYSCGSSNSSTSRSRYRPENGNLRKLWWTYYRGTVFALRKYLHQKEATGIESQEMYSPSSCKSPSYLCGPSNYPVSRESV